MPFTTELKYIEAAEFELGVQFPHAFRNYLLKNNGGELETLNESWEINPVLDTSDRRHTSRTANHIVSESLSARQWKRFPASAVAIASDGGGNHLILMPSSEDSTRLQATVFVWWHEGGEVEIVAQDFSAIPD